jgi:hypothetical protein
MSIRGKINARLRAIAGGYDRYFAPWAREVQYLEGEQRDYEIRLRDLRERESAAEDTRIRDEDWAALGADQRLEHLTERAAEMAANPWSVGSVMAVMKGTGIPEADRQEAARIAVERFGMDPVALPEAGTVEPELTEARTMTDIVNDCNAGRISAGEYWRQHVARENQLGYDAFWKEEDAAPKLHLTADTIRQILIAGREIAAEEAAREESGSSSGPREPWTQLVALTPHPRLDPDSPDYDEEYANIVAAEDPENYSDFWANTPTPDNYLETLADQPGAFTEAGRQRLQEAQASYAALSGDARERYLADRAAEIAGAEDPGGRSWVVAARMLRDGVPDDDLRHVSRTAAAWAQTMQAKPSEPELSTAVQVTKPDGSRFVTRDSDLEGARALYPPERGYRCELVTGYHNAEPAPEPEDEMEEALGANDMAELGIAPLPDHADLNAGAETGGVVFVLDRVDDPDAGDGFLAAPTAEDADPVHTAWVEASDRYDDLYQQQEADPEADLGTKITAAYYARQDAFGALHPFPTRPRTADASRSEALADSFTVSPDPEAPDPMRPWKVVVSDGGQFHAETAGAAHDAGLEVARVDAAPEAGELPTWAGSQSAADDASWDEPLPPSMLEAADLPVPYELTELGAGQAVADRMTEREVGPGYMAAPVADVEAGQ